jgi:transposase
MRSIGLDLGARHIAYCEVVNGKVVDRAEVKSLSELKSRLGPGTAPARVAFEACREGWHVHDTLESWGQDPAMLDTTRVRQMGVGQHGRKNDPIDAEVMAKSVESGHVALAHVLSPGRRALRAELSVRGALVETRAQYVTTIRGLARAAGVLLPSCDTAHFVDKLDVSVLGEPTRALVRPLVAMLRTLETELALVEQRLVVIAKADPVIQQCATVPGVGLIVAATFVSVIDEAKRFRNAHAVGAYLGLVPSESTTGGPKNRRLGSITKQGNGMARCVLTQAAWSIYRLRDPNDPLRQWVHHVAVRRHKLVAIVGLARKLAGLLWAIWRDGTVYDPKGHAKKAEQGILRTVDNELFRAHSLRQAAAKIQASASSPRAPKAPSKKASAPRSKAAKGSA